MKSQKLLLIAGAVAAAIAASASVAPAFATPLPNNATGSAIIANIPGTPDDGQVCRTGYTPALVGGTTFKCSKVQVLNIVLECLDPRFPNYVIRANNGAASDGVDLCTKNGVVITSSGPLGNLKDGQDFVKAAVNPVTITDRTNNKDHQEAVALGLGDNEVDTLAAPAVVRINGGSGSKDNADLTLTHFTFGIANRGVVIGPFPFAR